MDSEIPKTQSAIQLVGQNKLTLNSNKKIDMPGPYQILAEVEAVGLCFSDLKLLKQFASHARKGPVISGIEESVLRQIPSYVPNDLPTVPGHEAVVRIVKVGKKVKDVKQGERFLVQTDYRWLPTANSNAAFGYNFEGALQQYVLMDERVITSPDGDSMLIPASDTLSASAIALVEPWACVEDAYAVQERTGVKSDGLMLVVAEEEFDEKVFASFIDEFGRPGKITLVSSTNKLSSIGIPVENISDISKLEAGSFNDVIYFGSNPKTAESLFASVSANGLFNIVLCGGKFGKNVAALIGRVHYGNIRIVGTVGSNPADSMQYIPSTGEIRQDDKIDVVGAGGPMGTMHVIRNICQGVKGVTIHAGDLDDQRLESLAKIAQPLADKNNVRFDTYNPTKNPPAEASNYIVLMAPIPKLVAGAVNSAAKGAIINVFAGIAADVICEIDLDSYIEKQLYFIGTSGSTLDDMKTVLGKVQSGKLDTNISIAAISGFEGAIEGIRAVENHRIPGKIVVYPICKNLQLTELKDINKVMPEIGDCLADGLWNKEAEDTLLKLKGGKIGKES